MAMEFDLIPQGTLLRESGHGEAVDIRASSTRTFFCIMLIRDQIEQESVDVSIWGSADGENWGTHPVLKLPQQFYKEECRYLKHSSSCRAFQFLLQQNTQVHC